MSTFSDTFVMHEFSITVCTYISACVSLAGYNCIATSEFAISVTFEDIIMRGPLKQWDWFTVLFKIDCDN